MWEREWEKEIMVLAGVRTVYYEYLYTTMGNPLPNLLTLIDPRARGEGLLTSVS